MLKFLEFIIISNVIYHIDLSRDKFMLPGGLTRDTNCSERMFISVF